MKLMKLLPPGLLAFTLSLGVTAGSIYVTVSTATANNAAETAEAPAASESLETVSTETVAAADYDVPLTSDGSLTAKLSTISVPSGDLNPASGVNVSLISADGARIVTTTDADGFCAFGGLSPGVYSVEAGGSQGRLAFGIRAVHSDYEIARTGSEARYLPVSMNLDVSIHSALTLARDAGAVSDLINNASVAAVQPTTPSQTDSAVMAARYAAENTTAQSYLSNTTLQLAPDGSLAGQLHLLDPATGDVLPVEDLKVNFIADNTVVGSTTVNRDGSFLQHNLIPGVYSVVAAGGDGVGCIGVELTGSLASVEDPGQPIPTAARAADALALAVAKGSGGGGPGNGSPDESEEVPPAPLGGVPGAPGGGIGGGGGVPGGGGWGELLGAAGIALGAAALASDDDSGSASPGN